MHDLKLTESEAELYLRMSEDYINLFKKKYFTLTKEA